MLKIIIATILTVLISCSNDGKLKGDKEPDDDGGVIITGTTPPPIVIEPDQEQPEIETGAVKFTVLKDALYFYDGEYVWKWRDGKSARAESGLYANDILLYDLDEYGETESTSNLIDEPDFIALDGDDTWIIKNIPPADAYAEGFLYKDYTKIYLNSDEYGTWSSRQYMVDKIIVINGELFAHSTAGTWYGINSTKTNIKIVTDGFVCYDYNGTARTAKINGVSVSWSTNFMNSATDWQLSGTTWYSQNGYTWNGTTLNETGSSMTEWRTPPYLTGYSEAPVLINAGSNFENSETTLYWLECNSGWVVRYVPSTDAMTLHVRLYAGDGLRTSGLALKPTLQPAIIDGSMYYIVDGQAYKYDFATGINAFFMAGVEKVNKY